MNKINEHKIKEFKGARYCLKCHGVNDSITTDCPEKAIPFEYSERISYGNLDFRRGKGWVKCISPSGKRRVKDKIVDMINNREGCCKTDKEIMELMCLTKSDYMECKIEVEEEVRMFNLSLPEQNVTFISSKFLKIM